MWLSVPATVTLPLPLFGIDVYIQPDWWICQSCVTPAVSEIVHLLPCKIALNWGNPSVEARHGTLINFTAREREQCDAFTYGCWPSLTKTTAVNEPHKHFNPPPGMLILSYFKSSFERSSHYENSYWFQRCITSYWCKKAIENLPYWIVTYIIVAKLTDCCSEERLCGIHCAILWCFPSKWNFGSKL